MKFVRDNNHTFSIKLHIAGQLREFWFKTQKEKDEALRKYVRVIYPTIEKVYGHEIKFFYDWVEKDSKIVSHGFGYCPVCNVKQNVYNLSIKQLKSHLKSRMKVHFDRQHKGLTR